MRFVQRRRLAVVFHFDLDPSPSLDGILGTIAILFEINEIIPHAGCSREFDVITGDEDEDGIGVVTGCPLKLQRS